MPKKGEKGGIPWWVKAGKPNPATLVEVRAKISSKGKGRIPWNKGIDRGDAFRQLISKIRKEKPSPGQFKKGHPGYYLGKHLPDSVKAKISKRAKNENRISNVLKGVRPTKPEKYFARLCEEYQLPFRYVGNGDFWIGNLNPDFISIEGNRVAVEIFGDYYHSPLLFPMVQYQRTYEGRMKIFREYGWKLIIIWASELSNKEHVLKKLGYYSAVKEDVEKMCSVLGA